MSVWFKYAGDKDITTGHPGGLSLFNLPGGGFPAYGTYNSTLYGTPYETGSTVTVAMNSYYNQTCDVIVKNDGAGGTYTDWATATNIQYVTNGNTIVLGVSQSHQTAPVTIWGTSYNTSTAEGYNYYHNGSGGYYVEDYNVTSNYGTTLVDDYTNSQSTSNYYIINIFGTDLQKGKYTRYTVSGVGSYGAYDDQGSYFSYGTPTGVTDPGMGNMAYWDGNGGYYT